eukprot:3297013-Prymnesium_polylepis.1
MARGCGRTSSTRRCAATGSTRSLTSTSTTHCGGASTRTGRARRGAPSLRRNCSRSARCAMASRPAAPRARAAASRRASRRH